MSKIKFGNQLFYSHSYDFFRKKVQTASKEDWDSLWLPDHLSGMPGGAIDDFLSLWPMFGSIAELVKDKMLGTSVTDPHRIPPAALAQIATTINHINGGKFVLGIGAGEGMNLKAYQIPYDHALTKMRETIELMKLFWRKGKRVNYKGKFFQAKKAVLLPKPISDIPVWVAANGPKTLEMTAEIADGWMPIGLFPSVYKSSKEKIEGIMKDKGRDVSKFTFGVFQRIYINDDEKKISEQVNGTKISLAMQPRIIKELGYWKEDFDKIFCDATGFGCDEISLLQIDRDDVVRFDLKKLEPIFEQIPDDVIRENVMIGTKEDMIKKVETFVDAGVEHFIFEIVNGASSKNAPYTYWDVSRIINDDIITTYKA